MEKRVEGVYPNVEEALRAVDQLRIKGHAREDITIVANEDVRNNVDANVQENITVRDEGSDVSDNDGSMWESIKDFFTPDDSTDYGYDDENAPLYLYRDSIQEGKVVVLIDKGIEPSDTNEVSSMAEEQPNVLGSKTTSKDGEARGPDFDQLNVDKELRTDEMDDYERRQ